MRVARIIPYFWFIAWAATAWAQPSPVPGLPVDLTRLAWTAKAGFESADRFGFPPTATGVVAIQRFPVSLNTLFGVPAGTGTRDFTLQTVVHLDPRASRPDQSLGIRFATIGENWQVFWNGFSLARKIDRNPDGSLARRHTERDVVLPIPSGLMAAGDNRLVVLLIGDEPGTPLTSNESLGFYRSKGYRIDDAARLQDSYEMLVYVSIAAGVLFFSVYALVLFLFARGRGFYAHFAVLCASISLHFLLYSGLGFRIWYDTEWLFRLEYAALSVASPALLNFLLAYFGIKGGKFYTLGVANTALGVTLLLFDLAAPVRFLDLSLLVFEYSAIATFGVIFLFMGRMVLRGAPDALHMFPGLLALGATVVWDVLDSLVFSTGVRFSQFGFVAFLLALALVLGGRSLRSYRESERLNRELREREFRMRSLFEATFEAIAIHDHGVILEVNPAFAAMFGCDRDAVVGLKLADCFTGAKTAPGSSTAVPGQVYDAEGLRKGDERFFVEWVQKPHNYAGRAAQITAIRDVHARVAALETLRERNRELEIMQRSTIDRELRMVELKKENARLREQAAQPKKG